MPDAPAAAVAAAPAAAAPTLPPAPAPATDQIDTRVPGLIKRLFDYVEDDGKKPDDGTAPKPPEAPKAPDKKEPAAAEPPKPAAAPVTVRKPKPAARPPVPTAPVVVAPVAVAPAPGADTKPDPDWEKTLEENEREMLTDAREIEKLQPEKYPGFAAKTAKFLKDHEKLTSAADFDPDSAEYRKWLADNQPRLTRQQVREFEEVRVANKLKPGFEAEIQNVRYDSFVKEEEPRVLAEGARIFNELAQNTVPAEVLAAVKKDGYAKAEEIYKLELETAQEVIKAATDDIQEFLRVSRYDPVTKRALAPEAVDPAHPKFAQHERLRTMVKDVCLAFRNSPEGQKADAQGRYFATRDEWAGIPADQRRQWYTLTNQQIIERAKGGLKGVVANAIDQRRKWAEVRGFKRTLPEAPRASAPAAPTPPAAPRSAPIPGSDAAPPAGTDPRVSTVLKNLTKEQ